MAGAFRWYGWLPPSYAHQCASAMVCMGNVDRPALTLQQEIAIEYAQNGVEEMAWDGLWHFQALTSENRDDSYRRTKRLNRPAPKEPAAFKWVAADYAKNLFVAEAEKYPESPELQTWLNKLRERTMVRATQFLDKIEDEGVAQNRSFGYHGVPPEELFAVMGNAIDDAIQDRLSRSRPILPPPLPPEVTQQMRDQAPAPIAATTAPASFRSTLTGKEISAYTRAGIDIDSPAPLMVALHEQAKERASSREMPSIAGELPELQKEIARRARLLTDYKAATGAKDYHLYNAQNSGIHKPEFYQWVHGKLPAKSKTAKRFEAFLIAKKRPVRKNPATR